MEQARDCLIFLESYCHRHFIMVEISQIKYLCFEGGGGKGLAYLGVIQALEEIINKKIGPPEGGTPYSITSENKTPIIKISQPIKQRQILGVSGSSAGAITAFMVAMGMSHYEILQETNKVVRLSLGTLPNDIAVTQFEVFFDKPDLYKYRTNNRKSPSREYNNLSLAIRIIGNILSEFLNLFKLPFKPFVSDYEILAKKVLFTESNPLAATNLKQYFLSIVYNRGLLSGDASRKYFSELIEKYLFPKLSSLKMKKIKSKGENITFQDFFYMTGVDLVVTGTNISFGKPKYFSAAFTPDFSVVDAVSLSMSIPFLFRPYVIESEVNLDSNLPADYNKDYLGLYVDGGMLNNYPLHAFDYRPAKNINYQGDFANYFLASPNISLSATEFCDCILGIRLQNSVKEYEVSDDFKEGNSFIIRDFIGQLYSTILYPSEDGQIRSSLENNLSISIDVTDLELLDFSNPLINRQYRKLNALAEKQEKVIENAYKKIYENVQ